ncbi:MAG: glutaredoxin family protein [Patescibacteria group bacterium]
MATIVRDIIVYGAEWCGDCERSKRILKQHGISYILKDVDADPAADLELRALIGTGNRSLPRILFRSGIDTEHMEIVNTLIEPDDNSLLRELRLREWIKA